MKQVVLITGGSGKIGAAFIRDALKRGYFVVTTSRNREGYKQKQPDFFESNNFLAIECNVYDNDAADIIQSNLAKKDVIIDVIIHSARDLKNLEIGVDKTISEKKFTDELFFAVVFPYKLNNLLIKNGHPVSNIIFISSIYGIVAPTLSLYDDFESSSPINYGVGKAAQIHMVKELAVRLAPKGVRVNCISIGGIEGRTNKEFIHRYSKLTPQNRMLSTDDIIEPLHFLVSDASKNMTGHNLVVDGGWTIW